MSVFFLEIKKNELKNTSSVFACIKMVNLLFDIGYIYVYSFGCFLTLVIGRQELCYWITSITRNNNMNTITAIAGALELGYYSSTYF